MVDQGPVRSDRQIPPGDPTGMPPHLGTLADGGDSEPRPTANLVARPIYVGRAGPAGQGAHVGGSGWAGSKEHAFSPSCPWKEARASGGC